MAQPEGIPKQKNIIRIDMIKVKGRSGGGTHGWQVKFEFNEREISKFFGDNKYGGMISALDEAISFRDSFQVDLHAARADTLSHFTNKKGYSLKAVTLCFYWREVGIRTLGTLPYT